MQTRIVSLLTLVSLSWGNAISQNQTSVAKDIQVTGTDATFTFDNDEVGKLPADWTGATSTWLIASDGNNKAMKQAGKNEGDRFNICVQNKLN